MDFNTNHRFKNPYDHNSKIMITAILSLSFVILLVIILHIYARCALRHPRRRPPLDHLQPTNELTPPKSGLDPAVINLLPSFIYSHINGQDQIECAVCLSLLEEGELTRQLLNCNHTFHVACIDQWLSGQSTRPICRSDAAPRLPPLHREPQIGGGDNHDHQNHNHEGGKVMMNGSGPSSSSSSFRLSSFRRMLGRERSLSSRRIQVCGDLDLEGQV